LKTNTQKGNNLNFESGHIYHIYNQGNNREKIFFNKGNYLFFRDKIKQFVSPLADIIAWCLMPNHFHLMVFVNKTMVASVGATKPGITARESHPDISREFNHSIGIMLRSYTRAINIQQKRSGTLFREETKAICLSQPVKSPPNWYLSNGTTVLWSDFPEKSYMETCFNYILMNPVRSGLVDNPSQWEFSSFNEIAGDEILISKKRIEEFELKFMHK
jgi:putative transposase